MGDLEVDLDLLAATAGSLGMLIHEFSRAAAVVDDVEPYVGRNALLDELRDFVEEWENKRKLLLESMQSVYEMAAKGRQTYVDVDNRLATAITEASDPVPLRQP